MWELKEIENGMFTKFVIIDKNINKIASFVADKADYQEKKKKAQLMAAAPDMLETLKQSYEMIDTLAGLSSWDARSKDEINEVMNQILNAKNKAEGADE
jgi:hypothetical protein